MEIMVRRATRTSTRRGSVGRTLMRVCDEFHALELDVERGILSAERRDIPGCCRRELARMGVSPRANASGMNERDRRDFFRSTGEWFRTSADVREYEKRTGLVVAGRIRADERRGTNPWQQMNRSQRAAALRRMADRGRE